MPAFPFLKLPAELRVQIYRYLLRDDIYIDASKVLKERYWRCYDSDDLPENGMTYRDMYRVTAIGLHPAILSVNRQTYLEASRVLYSENCFKFFPSENVVSIHGIAAVIPFLEDRSEGSRHLIREIQCLYMETKTFIYPYQNGAEHDRVFAKTCDYLGQNLQLQQATLRFVCDNVRSVRSSVDFRLYMAYLDKHEWVQRLVPLVKKLKTFTLVGRGRGYAEVIKRILGAFGIASNGQCHLDWETTIYCEFNSDRDGSHPRFLSIPEYVTLSGRVLNK